MRIRLKYSIPISIFLIGLVLMMIKSYYEMQFTKENMLKKAHSQTRILGNRISNQLSNEWKNKHVDKFLVRNIVSSYMVDHLDQVDIYDENKNMLFTQYISSHKNDIKELLDIKVYDKLIKDKFSHLSFREKNRHIVGYFPIDLPQTKKTLMYSKSVGVLLLVFDISNQYKNMQENIYYTLMSNILVMLFMILSFSILGYIFIFRRLTLLHRATMKLSSGDTNVHVDACMNDELTDVIKTFNNMAIEMATYKNTMEEKIQHALEEHHQQNKIMIQQSKLASMGEMIGNIAHQWRQPLNALGLINQKIAILSKRGKLSDDMIQTNTSNANELIFSMSNTIDDFRDFFKPDKQAETFDIAEVVNASIKLLDSSLEDSHIKLYIDISQGECKIFGYKNEFIQVVVNIINNAKDALKEKSTGSRDIFINSVNENGIVTFNISDNAGGIPEDIINRIFEPYYTTKEEGKGTGIGLYMSKTIIEDNMNGNISAYNTEDGAMFKMRFKEKKDDK